MTPNHALQRTRPSHHCCTRSHGLPKAVIHHVKGPAVLIGSIQITADGVPVPFRLVEGEAREFMRGQSFEPDLKR